jgi:hypothetical protein
VEAKRRKVRVERRKAGWPGWIVLSGEFSGIKSGTSYFEVSALVKMVFWGEGF